MGRALIILWIATMGADRIDLLAGAGPMMLRPFLLLIAPLVVIELLRLGDRDRQIVLPPAATWLFVGHTLFLAVLLLSVMYSQEVGLAIQRFALLAVESYAAILAAIFLANRSDAREIVLRGAQWGILLIAIFNLVQVSRWLGGPAFDWMSLGGIVDFTPATYGPWLPRPSGLSLDANRGGLLLVVYLFITVAFSRPSRLRSILVAVGTLFLLATLSRSAVLAGLVVAASFALYRGSRLSYPAIVATSAGIAVAVLAIIVSPAVQEATLDLLGILARRVSIDEGSSGMHLALFSRGWEIGTGSVRNALLGIGFGNSFLVLQDIFPGTKYGNFHSAYISLLVESGIGALALFVALLMRPFYRPSIFTPMIAGLLVFNVFYQSHVDAILWFLLALAWILPDATQSGPMEDDSQPATDRLVVLERAGSTP